MDGRTSPILLTITLTLFSGCITTQPPKTTVTPATGDTPQVIKKDDGPKRNPLPATEIAFGKMKEAEADSETGKQNPESQAQLRDEARKAYQHALLIDKDNLDALRCLGRLYAKKGDFERAQEVFKKAMEKHSKDAGLWYDLGLCHNRRRDFNESVRCFTKAVEIEPENPEYLKMLGINLAWTGKVDQGLTYLIRAQGSAMAHFNIACYYDQKLQPELARQHCLLARRENGELIDQARDLLAALESPASAAFRRQ